MDIDMMKKGVAVIALIISEFLNWRCGKIELEPKDVNKKIGRMIGVITFSLALLKISGYSMVFGAVRILWSWWWILVIYIFFVGMLPPIMVYSERKKSYGVAQKGYARKNFGWNMLGSLSAALMVYIAYQIVGDFHFVNLDYIDEIVIILIPGCLRFALSYQENEQKNPAVKDHSASLKWKNQKYNVLHLFNVYFWALLSSVLIVIYTLYCHAHNLQIYLNGWHLGALSGVLVFFYACGLHKYSYIRFAFHVGVPIILVSSMYWMSLYTISGTMLAWQSVFVILHILIYVLIVFCKEDVIVISRTGRLKRKIKVRDWFPIDMTLVMLAAYAVLVAASVPEESITFNYAQKCLDEICDGTEKDPQELFEEIKGSEWADGKKGEVDRERYLIFLYDNLLEEMKGKGILTGEDSFLSLEQLDAWYDNLPPKLE